MSGRDGRRVPGAGAREERAELDVAIAHGARHGRATRLVLSREVVDHRAFEFGLAIEEIVGNAEPARDLPRIVHRGGRAAASETLRRVRRLLPRPDAQCDAYHVETLLDEERGGDRRVDAAGETYDDALSHDPSLRDLGPPAGDELGQSLEVLGRGVGDLDAPGAFVADEAHTRGERLPE